MTTLKNVCVTVGGALAFFGALTLGSVAIASDIVNIVTVGGNDVCEAIDDQPGCDGNLSLIAMKFDDGTVTGRLTDRYKWGAGFNGTVTCLVVDGNSAWISGEGWYFEGGKAVQRKFFIKVVDNGNRAQDPPDQTSFAYNNNGLQSCEFYYTIDQAYISLWDYTRGQIKVN